jgi:hypothetical protein
MYKAFIRFCHGRCVLRGVRDSGSGIRNQGLGTRDSGLGIQGPVAGPNGVRPRREHHPPLVTGHCS